MATALITGASAGIGLAFAERFASEGLDLVLVARNRDSLDQLAERLHKAHGISIEVMSADLSVRTDVDRVGDRLADPLKPIEILVNNAGFLLLGVVKIFAVTVLERTHGLDSPAQMFFPVFSQPRIVGHFLPDFLAVFSVIRQVRFRKDAEQVEGFAPP